MVEELEARTYDDNTVTLYCTFCSKDELLALYDQNKSDSENREFLEEFLSKRGIEY